MPRPAHATRTACHGHKSSFLSTGLRSRFTHDHQSSKPGKTPSKSWGALFPPLTPDNKRCFPPFFSAKKNTLLMTIMTAVSVPSSSSSSSYFGNSASSSQPVMITKIYFYPDRPASHCPDAGKLCLRERKHFYLDVAFATCCRRNLNLAGGAVFRITCRDRLVRTFFVLAKLSYNVKDYYSI